MEKPPS